MVESSKHVKPWRDAVRSDAADAIGHLDDEWPGLPARHRPPLDCPLVVDMVFTFARPKSHYRTGRNAHLLRDAAPPHPTGPPDLSKLARSTEDALTDAGVWRDDALVVAYGQLAKVYPGTHPDALDSPGAVIRIRPTQETPDA
jgi:hypothetical protein